jgi:hypothetical protein
MASSVQFNGKSSVPPPPKKKDSSWAASAYILRMFVRMLTRNSAISSEAFVVFLSPFQGGWYSGNAPAEWFLGFYEPMLKQCRLLLNPYLSLFTIHVPLLTSRCVSHSIETAANKLRMTKIALFGM